MKPEQLLPDLEALATRVGVSVRYEGLAQSGVSNSGGLCKVRGEYWLIVDKKSTPSERVAILLDALARFDTASLDVAPKIEELLASRRATKSQTSATP